LKRRKTSAVEDEIQEETIDSGGDKEKTSAIGDEIHLKTVAEIRADAMKDFDDSIIFPDYHYERMSKEGLKVVIERFANGGKRMLTSVTTCEPGGGITPVDSDLLSGPPSRLGPRTVVQPMVVVAPRDLATLRATTMVEPVVLMDQYDVMQANKQLKAQLAECEKQKAAAYKQCEEQAESISVYELKVRIVFNL
jgi:hypothetical protein